MTNPSSARRLLLVLVTSLLGVTLSSVSLAASSPSPHGHEKSSAAPRRAPLQRQPAHPSATTPKAKQPVALHPAHRQAPLKARVAAKSKTPSRAHKAAGKPAKSVAKNSKHAA